MTTYGSEKSRLSGKEGDDLLWSTTSEKSSPVKGCARPVSKPTTSGKAFRCSITPECQAAMPKSTVARDKPSHLVVLIAERVIMMKDPGGPGGPSLQSGQNARASTA